MGEIILMIFLLLFYAIILAVGIGEYITNALGLYRAANTHNVKNPWIAWIPVADMWTLGSIADAVDTGKNLKRRWAKSLIGLYIGVFVTIIPAYIALFIFVLTAGLSDSDELVGAALIMFFVFYALILVAAFVSIIAQALTYICMYKVFENAVPEKSLKYLILSLIVPLAFGICLMKAYPKETDSKPDFDIQPQV